MENQDQLISEKDIRQMSRVHGRVLNHITKHGRTLQEEAALVEQKKSHLSKAERDYVMLAAHFESLQPKDGEYELTKTEQND